MYRAGPLILAAGDGLAQHPEVWTTRRMSGSEVIAVLTGRQAAVLSVDGVSRSVLAAVHAIWPGAPVPGVVRRARHDTLPRLLWARAPLRRRCAGLFKGRGCARLHVEQRGLPAIPMLIPIGNTLHDCPARGPMQTLGAAARPFLGVSCRVPNSIACDRVGIGVRLRRKATLVMVQVAGRLVTLSPPLDPPDDLWLGYLFGADLRHGPLKVHVPANTHLWFGSPEVNPRLRVTAFFPNGSAATRGATVLVHPGFG